MFDAVEAWHQSPEWHRDWSYHRHLVQMAGRVCAAFGQLRADADPGTVTAVVRPLLGEVWGSDVEAAMDQLRWYAMHRPPLCRHARHCTLRDEA